MHAISTPIAFHFRNGDSESQNPIIIWSEQDINKASSLLKQDL